MSKYNVELSNNFKKEETESLIEWLTYVKFNPRRLRDICRISIRSQMGNKVLLLVPALEIPQSLKQYLLFQDIPVHHK